MLKENIQYSEALPVNCEIMHLRDYPIHFHNDMEVVYVLQGRVMLKNGYYNYEMEEGDIYILNDREIHSYDSKGNPNVVLILQLNLSYFTRYYELLKNSFFVTDVNDSQDESLVELRELLARIALENLCGGKGYEERVISLTHDLINCLISNFQYFAMEDGRFINETKNKGNKILAGRLKRIIEYMYENYSRRLTLSEIAEKEHLSIYYLSHFIKEATGLGFQELLSFIRVEESEKLILGSDKKIGAISLESGFSAVRYYIKYFTKWFGMHPLDYRSKYTNRVKGGNNSANYISLEKEDAKTLLSRYVDDIFSVSFKSQADVVSVEFDTGEYVWSEDNSKELFSSLIGADFMRPMGLIIEESGIGPDDVVAHEPGYFIMRNFQEGRAGGGEPFYSILLYNFCHELSGLDFEHLPFNRIIDRIDKFDKQTEYYIKLSSIDGLFQIARCSFTKEALLARYRIVSEGSELRSRRRRIAETWSASPFFSVKQVSVSQVLGIQSHQCGSTVELILIDPI